jgi:hypothetical protein
LDAVSGDCGSDEATLRLAIRARQMRAERDYRLDNAAAALDVQLLKGQPEVPPTNPTAAIDDTSASIDSASSAGASPSAAVSALVPGNISASNRRAVSPFDDKDFHPLSSERAGAIARWVTEAPAPNTASGLGEGPRKRRKRPVKKMTAAVDGSGAAANVSVAVAAEGTSAAG